MFQVQRAVRGKGKVLPRHSNMLGGADGLRDTSVPRPVMTFSLGNWFFLPLRVDGGLLGEIFLVRRLPQLLTLTFTHCPVRAIVTQHSLQLSPQPCGHNTPLHLPKLLTTDTPKPALELLLSTHGKHFPNLAYKTTDPLL